MYAAHGGRWPRNFGTIDNVFFFFLYLCGSAGVHTMGYYNTLLHCRFKGRYQSRRPLAPCQFKYRPNTKRCSAAYLYIICIYYIRTMYVIKILSTIRHDNIKMRFWNPITFLIFSPDPNHPRHRAATAIARPSVTITRTPKNNFIFTRIIIPIYQEKAKEKTFTRNLIITNIRNAINKIRKNKRENILTRPGHVTCRF